MESLDGKDLVYLSDTKLQDYSAQMERTLLSWFKELSRAWQVFRIHGGPIEMTIGRTADTSLRLQFKRVISSIHRQAAAGTVRQPKRYFASTMSMRWGLLSNDPQSGDGLIFFSGNEGEDIIVVLAGSLDHAVRSEIWTRPPIKSVRTVTRVLAPYIMYMAQTRRVTPSELTADSALTQVALGAANSTTSTIGYFEFLAETLHSGFIMHPTKGRIRILFGSPIYVAKLEGPDSGQTVATSTQCQHCGATLRTSGHFCNACGLPVTGTLFEKECLSCSGKYRAGANFCNRCGKRLV